MGLGGWQGVPQLDTSQAVFLPEQIPVVKYLPAMRAACGGTVLRLWMLSHVRVCSSQNLLPAPAVGRHRRPLVRVSRCKCIPILSHDLKVFRNLYCCCACGRVTGSGVVQLG